jgi:hypothetical protein
VIFISELFPRFTRLIGRRDPVATLATLILGGNPLNGFLYLPLPIAGFVLYSSI